MSFQKRVIFQDLYSSKHIKIMFGDVLSKKKKYKAHLPTILNSSWLALKYKR